MTAEMPRAVRVGFSVLDRQIIDREGREVGKVDDVELTWEGDSTGRYVLTALLTDSAALGPRLAGRLGRIWQTVLRRLRPEAREPGRIPIEDVTAFTPTTRLRTEGPGEVWALENWLREHVIRHVPGAGDADDTHE